MNRSVLLAAPIKVIESVREIKREHGTSQLTFTCLKSTIKTVEKGVK